MLVLKLAAVILLSVGLGLAYLRLSSGPVSFAWLEPRVAAGIAERLGPGWSVDLRDSAIEIDRDGAMQGPNVAATHALARAVSIPVIASGCVSSLADLIALRDAGSIAGAIYGRALYDGALDLSEALAALA